MHPIEERCDGGGTGRVNLGGFPVRAFSKSARSFVARRLPARELGGASRRTRRDSRLKVTPAPGPSTALGTTEYRDFEKGPASPWIGSARPPERILPS